MTLRIAQACKIHIEGGIQAHDYYWLIEIENITYTARLCFIPSYSEDWLRRKLYDKRDHLNFLIVNFPFICNNIPSHWPIVILGSLASLLATTLYLGNTDRTHNRWDIWAAERYTLHMQVVMEELLALPRHMAHLGFSGSRVSPSVVFCVVFCRS
jgi:hypothetical protein